MTTSSTITRTAAAAAAIATLAWAVSPAAADVGGRHVAAAPSAAGFAKVFMSLTNAYAASHHDHARVSHADCVRASQTHYMCSYVATRGDGVDECHLMQATWTPERASTFTVTLAGRVRRCATLHEALQSLG
jgi:hypothetical protein